MFICFEGVNGTRVKINTFEIAAYHELEINGQRVTNIHLKSEQVFTVTSTIAQIEEVETKASENLVSKVGTSESRFTARAMTTAFLHKLRNDRKIHEFELEEPGAKEAFEAAKTMLAAEKAVKAAEDSKKATETTPPEV
jgi:hypothetical protein